MIAGTAGYLSPEQAKGGTVDARSDVFSFGAVLYEMVTGRRAFAGSSTAETLAAVVRDEPKAASEVVSGVPHDLDRLIQRCLRKDVDRRVRHMLDVKLELEQVREDSDLGRPVVRVRRRRRPWIVAAAAAAVVVALFGAIARWRSSAEAPLDPPRLAPPVTSMRGAELEPALSPDGEQVAFSWFGEKQDNRDIYLKLVGSSEVRRVTTDPALDVTPSWSPDGRQIAFVRVSSPDLIGRIYLVSPIGGTDRKLSDFPHAGGAPSWSPDGRWLAAARASTTKGAGILPGLPGSDGLYLVPVNGGEPRRLALDGETGDAFAPQVALDGRHLSFSSCSGFSCWVAVVDLGPGYV
jgi:eukaryotic-like serine/threonine-protein kinase